VRNALKKLGRSEWLRECPVEVMFVSLYNMHSAYKSAYTRSNPFNRKTDTWRQNSLFFKCVIKTGNMCTAYMRKKTAFLRFINLKFEFCCDPRPHWGTFVPQSQTPWNLNFHAQETSYAAGPDTAALSCDTTRQFADWRTWRLEHSRHKNE